MGLNFINKVFFMLFFLSILIVVRHSFFFIQTWILSNDETPIKYKLNKISLFFLGLSISFLLTTLFTGIKL